MQQGRDEPVVGVEVVAEVVVPGHLAAEDRVLFAHAAFDERVPDAVHQRLAAVARHDVLHRVAGAHVVDDRRARMPHQERFGEQRRDEVAGDELAAAVDEEAAIGVAVPGNSHVRLLGDDAFDDVAAVVFDQRIGFVVRERAIDFEAQPCRPAGQLIEQARRDEAGDAAAGIEHDVEGLDGVAVDERHHVIDVAIHDLVVFDATGTGRRAREWRRRGSSLSFP